MTKDRLKISLYHYNFFLDLYYQMNRHVALLLKNPPSWKIFLFQNALDPHVDRKCLQPLVGKKHHTISNLRAHARQLTQTSSQSFVGELPPLFKIDLAGGDEVRRSEQILRPVTECTRPQVLLGQIRYPVRRRE